MKNTSLFLILVSLSQIAYGALPPEYQKMKDLNVMVEFIKEHELILTRLESIDFENYAIRYEGGCTAFFGRKIILRPQGWVGPADPLEFKRSSCNIDY